MSSLADFDELLPSWKQGVEEFNQGRYWHAHEYWERGWKSLPEPQRTYVQALIQVAAVFHLMEKGRLRPARALCTAALEKFERSQSVGQVLPRIEISEAKRVLEGVLRGEVTLSSAFQLGLKAKLLLPPSV